MIAPWQHEDSTTEAPSRAVCVSNDALFRHVGDMWLVQARVKLMLVTLSLRVSRTGQAHACQWAFFTVESSRGANTADHSLAPTPLRTESFQCLTSAQELAVIACRCRLN